MGQYDYLRDNIADIKRKMSEASLRAGRNPQDVRLIAVTKTVPPELINKAIEFGIDAIGENKVQEWMQKRESICSQNVHINFIGQLQRNKLKYIFKEANIIHSLDRLPLATELERLCAQAEITKDVLIQVNIGREEQKGGILEEELEGFARELSMLSHMRVQGLMCVPPFDEPPRGYFERLRELSAMIKARGFPNIAMNELSMGMSHDFEEAILEGATMIRVGTALFGKRV